MTLHPFSFPPPALLFRPTILKAHPGLMEMAPSRANLLAAETPDTFFVIKRQPFAFLFQGIGRTISTHRSQPTHTASSKAGLEVTAFFKPILMRSGSPQVSPQSGGSSNFGIFT